MKSHDNLKQTPLYRRHVELKGNIVDFGGWALPTNYPAGVLTEHRTVRGAVGLFDVSHMGELRIRGTQALDLMQMLVANDVAALRDNQIQYAHMLYPTGGVVDDILVYRISSDEYYLVVNASNHDKDVAWISDVAKQFPEAEVVDESEETAELALQGPAAAQVLAGLTEDDLSQLGYYWFLPSSSVAGIRCLVSRTGYTGEDGFELFCCSADAVRLWDSLMEAGAEAGILPIGLGARDSLRFEAGMPLYGQELDENTSPLEAGLGRFVDLDKADFIGRDALVAQKREGLRRRLVGFEMIERAIARTGYPIVVEDKPVGHVTTGSYSPTLDINIGNGFVPVEHGSLGSEIGIDVRGRVRQAKVRRRPFYRRK